jgi:uncharacterized damage-inducible protein DinB
MTAELQSYQSYFENLHQQAIGLLNDLPAEALNWRPLPGGAVHDTNSLAANAVHIAGSARWLVGEMVAGRPANRDREAEFRTTADDSDSLQQSLAASAAFVAEVLTSLPAEALDESVTIREQPRTRRWALLHSLTHTALHVGHMQLTRQLWEAQAGDTAPD